MNEKYLKHIMSDAIYRRPDVQGRVFSLPVCPRCERPAFRDKGYTQNGTVSCPHCGYTGFSGRTVGFHAKEV